MHLRTRVLLCAAAALLLAGSGAAGGWDAQAGGSQGAANAAHTTQQPGTVTQPSLTVDRDPVASPDPDAPAARGRSEGPAAREGQITREGGRYTLRADAYEVRLNATVLDADGRSILTL